VSQPNLNKLITTEHSETQPRITQDRGRILFSEMGGGMHRPSAQYTSKFERTVCSGENNRIAKCYFQNVSQRCGEAKSISI
jgi:hypothetical protein